VSRSKRSALFALASIPLIMTLGNSMLIPVLPAIRRELELTPFQTSLIITVFSVMAILFIPPAGWLSDRIGRKRVILPCLILSGIGGAVCAAAVIGLKHPYPYLLAGRILQGRPAGKPGPERRMPPAARCRALPRLVPGMRRITGASGFRDPKNGPGPKPGLLSGGCRHATSSWAGVNASSG